MYDYLDKSKHLFANQSGFRALHSVVTCLLNSTDDWYVNMDNGKYTAMIFIDLKKAFDTVDHDILLAKLRKYGIENVELTWFTSYLTNRKQFCKVNGFVLKLKKFTMVFLRVPALALSCFLSISMTFHSPSAKVK